MLGALRGIALARLGKFPRAAKRREERSENRFDDLSYDRFARSFVRSKKLARTAELQRL